MFRIVRSMLFVAAFFAIAVPAGAQSAAVERPLKKVGDSCSYKVINDWNGSVTAEYSLEVTAVTDDGYNLVKKSKTGEVLESLKDTLDLNALSWGGTKYTPNTAFYSFPLFVGKTWQAKANWVKNNGRVGSYALTAKVVGEEKVADLPTLKISYEGNYQASNGGNSGKGTMKMTRWYAPSVGCTAKEHYEDTNWSGRVYNKDTTLLTAYKIN